MVRGKETGTEAEDRRPRDHDAWNVATLNGTR